MKVTRPGYTGASFCRFVRALARAPRGGSADRGRRKGHKRGGLGSRDDAAEVEAEKVA